MLDESFMHVDEFKAKNEEFITKTQDLAEKLNKVNEELKVSQTNKCELEKIIEGHNQSFIELNNKIESGENILNENQKTIENFITEKLELQTKILGMQSELETANMENVSKIDKQQKMIEILESQTLELNEKIKTYEEKLSENDTNMQEMKAKYEKELEELQEKNLDSESDLSSNYEAREVELKKNFKNKVQELKRENTLIEKKYNLYKDMYKKLKNEKLDIVQYGSNTTATFVNPDFGSNNEALNISDLAEN